MEELEEDNEDWNANGSLYVSVFVSECERNGRVRTSMARFKR